MDSVISEPPRFFTVAGAAQWTGLSADSIRAMIDSHKVAAFRPVRGRILVGRLELERAILDSAAPQLDSRGAAARKRERDDGGRFLDYGKGQRVRDAGDDVGTVETVETVEQFDDEHTDH